MTSKASITKTKFRLTMQEITIKLIRYLMFQDLFNNVFVVFIILEFNPNTLCVTGLIFLEGSYLIM